LTRLWQHSALVLLPLLAACTEQNELAGELAQIVAVDTALSKWKLPSRMREISGLALTPGGQLFAVDDEQAVIYELDFSTGRLLQAFAVGNPVLRGDFEGIAYLDEHLFLVTSNGILFKVRVGDDGDRVAYQKIDTGLGRQCEIEGLAQDPQRGNLLLACKKVRKKADISKLSVFVWTAGDTSVDLKARIEVPMEKILAELETPAFNPSGIVVDPVTGNLLIIAARQHALISMDRQGNFVGAMMLSPAKWHRQAEGVEASAMAQLIVADEGGKSRARLTVYDKFHARLNENIE